MRKLFVVIVSFVLMSMDGWGISQEPFVGARINRSHPLSNGLIGHWPLNEGTGDMVYDTSSNEKTGTMTLMDPATDWVAGDHGFALEFDSVDDKISLPKTFSFKICTIAVWINVPNTTNAYRYLFDFRSNSSNYIFSRIYQDDVKFRKQLATGVYANDNAVINFGVWQYFVYVLNDTEVSLYIDGELITKHAGLPSGTTGTADYAVIGKQFDGQIKSFMIYDRALSAIEVARLYEDPYQIYERLDFVVSVGVAASPATTTYRRRVIISDWTK